MQKKKKVTADTPRTVALIGNPNVGKSTLFNALTGMHQHTGNWCGKTVECAQGKRQYQGKEYQFTDLPGCYSLASRSPEEDISRKYLFERAPDVIVAVCDATCLERNLNLVLQLCTLTPRILLCINLIDEAKKNKIHIDFVKLKEQLQIPVIGISARNKKSIRCIFHGIDAAYQNRSCLEPYPDSYESTPDIELQMMEHFGTYIQQAASICQSTVFFQSEKHFSADRKLDRLFTSRKTGIPIMLLFLLAIFWITIVGANIPSKWLNQGLFWLEPKLYQGLISLGIPVVLCQLLVYGIYRVAAWVVSVMLPPMAIFFPLFTLLEDFGYLPRIAFNLDYCYQKCCACGKQALTTCMGFGCNAVGVTGCRIIDSPRERLIAILTNSFIPCNGRFPTLLSILLMFFVAGTTKGASLQAALLLACVILLGIFMTFFASWLLSKTILKGVPSSFTLELPPYRRPQIFQVLVRSILDRTLHVLWRAVTAAAPAGLIIWLLANVHIGETSVLNACAGFLDPFGHLLGLDGIILLAFILGFPANEIVIPIMVMAYTAQSTLADAENLTQLHTLLVQNGWTVYTAVSMLFLTLMHWPCATTLLTIKKETHSRKWTLLAFLLPTVMGFLCCFLFTLFVRTFIH